MLITHTLSKSDKIIFKEIFYDNIYEEGLRGLATVKEIIDIGGNFGGFMLYAADRYPNATIRVFEPTKSLFDILKQNIKVNELEKIIPFNVGVWSSIGTRELYQYDGGGLNSLVYAKIDELPLVTKEKCMVLPLDVIISGKSIDLLKIDCEGSEYEILYNCKKLNQIRRIVGEYHEFDSDLSHRGVLLERHLKNEGFKTYFQYNIGKKVGSFYAKK